MELNVNRVQRWISEVVCQELGTELYRYKGVLAVKGMKRKFVFQGVHMLFTGAYMSEEFAEDGSDRECRFVFIGKQVKQKHGEKLRQGFMECEAEKTLRFKVGDTVMAKTSRGFKKATVLKLWDQGKCYRLELQTEKKTNVWGLEDTDDFVRAA